MILSDWQPQLNLECKLAITDIHRLKDLKNLIKSSEKKLAIMLQNPKCNNKEIIFERTILKASKHLEDRLERILLFTEIQ